MMRKFLLALVMCLFTIPALAGMNIKQNGDGTADWEDASGNRFNVGAVYLRVRIADFATASTTAVIVPIPNAHISRIEHVLNNNTATAAGTINFYAGSITPAAITTSNEVSNGGSPMSTASGSATGTTTTFTPSLQHAVEQGDVIWITNRGESTNDGAGAVDLTITIEPDGT